MVTLSLLARDVERHEFSKFYVEVWRAPESGIRYFCLVGKECKLCMSLTLRLFPVIKEKDVLSVYDDSLEVSDMLNYLLELKREERTESEALQLTAALYPEHFKYLAELGYESPAEGGAPDGCNSESVRG